MAKRFRSILILVALAALAVLPACGAATPAPPTVDPNAIYTQAVMTVSAGLTETAAARPTDTPTPEPSSTPEPSPTLPLPPTATQIDQTAMAQPTLAQPAINTPAPTQAGARPVATTAEMGKAGDHASFGSQSPADNTRFPGLSNQQVFWSLVNTGTTTWTTGYKLVWVGGRQLSGEVSIPVTKDVKPGQKFDFYTRMVTPEDKGTYTSYWKLTTPGGQQFYEVYLKFIVE